MTFIEDRKTWSEIFLTRAAALSAQRAFERKHQASQTVTVAEMLVRYLEHYVRKGTKPVSVENYGGRLRTFFGYTQLIEQPMAGVTTEAARAAYDSYIPSCLVPLVLTLAARRPPEGLLFVPEADGRPQPRQKTLRMRLLRKVKKICRLARVDEVVVHSFRGLYATLGVSHTGDRDLIARQLGHASPRVTEQNYINGRVAAVAEQQRVQQRLGLSLPEPGSAVMYQDATRLLDAVTEHLSVPQLHKLTQHLVQTITAKAALPARSRAAPKALADRSRSNTEQVRGSLRNLSAAPLIGSISDGEP